MLKDTILEIEKIDKEQRIVYFDGDQNCLISRSKMKGLKESLMAYQSWFGNTK